jgi:hypothetical protein
MRMNRVGRKADPGLAILDSALDYVYGESQAAQADGCTQDGKEDFDIALRLIGLLRGSCRGHSLPADPFAVAVSQAVGLTHAKYLERRQQRYDFLEDQLAHCIADYDPNDDPAKAKPAAQARTGTMREMLERSRMA